MATVEMTAEQKKVHDLQMQQRKVAEELKHAREAAENSLTPAEKIKKNGLKLLGKINSSIRKGDFVEANGFWKQLGKEIDEGRKIQA
jgi:hypothetical protein